MSKEQGLECTGLECKNPPKSVINLAEESDIRGSKAGAGLQRL